MRKHFPQLEPRSFKFLKNWERIYLEKEEVGFYVERRGRTKKMDNSKKGRPRKKPLDKQVENDLIRFIVVLWFIFYIGNKVKNKIPINASATEIHSFFFGFCAVQYASTVDTMIVPPVTIG